MYGRWMLFRVEIKKFMAVLPVIMAETFLLGLILLGIGFCAQKALYGEKAVGEIRVGIVARGEDRLTELLLGFVESMDSIKGTVSFTRLSEEEARKGLLTGELYAAMLVPEGIVDSVNSGENEPVTVLLANDYSQAETEVFAQLTQAGEKLLSVAQAGIYAADALWIEEGLPERIKGAEEYLNREYLDYAMGRSSFFKEKEVSAAQGVSLADYYGISLLLAFVSFAGLSFGRCMQVETGQKEKMFGMWGIGTGQRYVIEAAAFGCVFALMGTILGFLLYLPLGRATGSTFTLGTGWLRMVLLWFAVGLFLRMLFQFTGNHTGGIGLCFAVLMALMLLSGVFIPEAFLPLWAERLGKYIPYNRWIESLGLILQNNFGWRDALALVGGMILFLLAGGMAALFRGRWSVPIGKVISLKKKETKGDSSGLFFSKGRQLLRLYEILWKQYWIKYRLWIAFVVVAAFVFGFLRNSFFESKELRGIGVGICVSDEKGRELLGGLLEEKGIFRFEGYEDEEEMLRRIKNGSLECGYVFPEGFYDRLTDKKLRRQATLYHSPASSVHRIAGEVVFAQLFELLSGNVLENYLLINKYGNGVDFDRIKDRLYALNEEYAKNDSTFHFVYESLGGKSGEKPSRLNTVRGLIALMVFLMSILGMGNMLEQKNTWASLPGRMRKSFQAGSIHVAVLGSVLTGGICLALTGSMGELIKELAGLALYFAALEVFVWLLRLFVKSSRGLYGLVPAFLLCCCLFCPIFIRIERYLPEMAWISGLFPISCYLKLFL